MLVIALHLLSTSGTWWITDHGEILAVAHNFLGGRGLTLDGLSPAWESLSRIAEARQNTDTRFLPLSILSLTPFLMLDHALGWRDPGELRFVHLQGHFFVGVALLMAGRFVAGRSGGPTGAALCVLVAGLNWPVWMIARRLGPEPVLLAMVTALVTLGPRGRFVCLVLLPWVHASGPLLGLGALVWLAVDEGSWTSRSVRHATLAWFLGSLSVVLLWNIPIHGDALLGGYSSYRGDRFFTLRNPIIGSLMLVGRVLAFTLPIAYLVGCGGRGMLLRVCAFAGPSAAFFGAFSSPEPERRLAPLVVACAVMATARMSRPTAEAALSLALFSLASGVLGLTSDFVAFIETPLGVFSGPHLLLIRMAFVEGRPVVAGSTAALLGMVAFVAASRTIRCLTPGGTLGSSGTPHPESRS